jgi:hypothetical protein
MSLSVCLLMYLDDGGRLVDVAGGSDVVNDEGPPKYDLFSFVIKINK